MQYNKVLLMDARSILVRNGSGISGYMPIGVRRGYIDFINSLNAHASNYHFYSPDGRHFDMGIFFVDVPSPNKFPDTEDDCCEFVGKVDEAVGSGVYAPDELGLDRLRDDASACVSNIYEVDDVANAMVLSDDDVLVELARANGFFVFDPRKFGYQIDRLQAAIKEKMFDGWEMDPQFGDVSIDDLVPIGPAGSLPPIIS